MTTVSLKEFGQMVADVKNISEDVKEVKLEMKGIHTRIDNHMDKEERERKEMLGIMAENAKASQERHDAIQESTAARFEKIEEFMLFVKKWIWAFIGIGFTLPIISALVLLLLRIILNKIAPDSGLADLFGLLFDSIPYYG